MICSTKFPSEPYRSKIGDWFSLNKNLVEIGFPQGSSMQIAGHTKYIIEGLTSLCSDALEVSLVVVCMILLTL